MPIEAVRELIGSAPRTFEPKIQEYLHIVPPQWALRDAEMRIAYDRQDIIRRDGQVVWATIVQANKLLFARGPFDHPASMIFSEDPYYDDHPEELREMARDLFLVKGTDQADAESAAFARMLTSELIRAPMLRVPSRFTGGRRVFHSSMMLPRKHLPKGVLGGWLMPVWIDPARNGALLLVPAAYWPASLFAAWDQD